MALAVGAATLALALPSALFLCARIWFSPARLIRTLYGLPPLIWALLLARHLALGMAEAGTLLPASGLLAAPAWIADPHLMAFCQSAPVVLGLSWALVLLRRQLARLRQASLVALALPLLLAAAGRWLMAFSLA
jgi:hypothetical protein